MSCLLIVLRHVAIAVAIAAGAGAVTIAMIGLAIWSAKVLSLPDSSSGVFFITYGAICLGAWMGVIECRHKALTYKECEA